MARESKNGGSVKSNAAAIQSSGRRGILVSLFIKLLLVLVLLLMLMVGTDSKRAGSSENAFAQEREKFQHPEGEGHKAAVHVQPRSPTA